MILLQVDDENFSEMTNPVIALAILDFVFFFEK